jgi:hypothetical protein
MTRLSLLFAYQAPLEIIEPADEIGGSPKKLGPGRYAVHEEPVRIPGGAAAVSVYNGPVQSTPGLPLVELNARVKRIDHLPQSHVEHGNLLMSLIDHIEFSLQQPIQVIAFDALDAAPDLVAGLEREVVNYTDPASSLGDRCWVHPTICGGTSSAPGVSPWLAWRSPKASLHLHAGGISRR